jgi:hypothetical protein
VSDVSIGNPNPEARTVEQIVNLHIERLPEGLYLATSDDVPGFVAQGRTLSEALETARDVSRRILRGAGGARGPRPPARTWMRVRLPFGRERLSGAPLRVQLPGCRQAAGSHEIWYNPATNRHTKLPNHPSNLPEGTLRAILKQAGVEPDEFLRAR